MSAILFEVAPACKRERVRFRILKRNLKGESPIDVVNLDLRHSPRRETLHPHPQTSMSMSRAKYKMISAL
jgi:hypothetical protein